MNKPWRIGAIIALLVIGGLFTVLLTHRSRSRGTLAKFKAQLRARGEKLTYAELYQLRSTQYNNGLTLLTNAAKKLSLTSLTPGLLAPRTFVSPGQAVPAWELPLPSGVGAGGSNATWESFSAQMEANAAVLAELREILKNPPLDSGSRTSLFFQPIYNFVAARTAGQWLMGDACNELRLGHREKALEDLVALAGLARMNSEEYTLISQMIRVALTGLGIAVTWDALQSPGWTEPELLRLQEAWEPDDLRDGLERAFLGERANGADFFSANQAFAKTRIITGTPPKSSLSDFAADHVAWPVYKMTVAADDELLHLQSMQDTIEALRDLQHNGSWKESATTLNQTLARITRIGSSPQGFMYWFSRIAIPNTVKAVNTGVRTETDRQLLLAEIALRRFQLRHGRFPATLEQLAPEFLHKVPHDYMSGRPPLYRSTTNDFVLYSVGEDGRDDGGSAAPITSNRFGLWEGKDAVWPSHASVTER
jgi:type II secretory pathway pseudopilin PulG